jgi:hypothetical protein
MSRTIRVLAVALISSFALAACTGSPTGVDAPAPAMDTIPWT